jgi:hypothetical protein
MRLNILYLFNILFLPTSCSVEKKDISKIKKEQIIKEILSKASQKIAFLKEKRKEQKNLS